MATTSQIPPPTYSRGQSRIDYMFVSALILPAVIRSGILPFNKIFLSDHRACFIELKAEVLFGTEMPTIHRLIGRGLRLHGPRIVNKYLDTLHRQLECRKIETKVNALHSAAISNYHTSDLEHMYEQIDRTITKSMLHAESKSSKKYSKKKRWVTYSQVCGKSRSILAIMFSLKRFKGLKVSDKQLAMVAVAANLHDEHKTAAPTLPEIIQRIHTARTELRDLQKQLIELRITHLESLAEARLLHKNQNHHLLHPDKQEEARKKEVRRIKRTERIRRTHRRVRACFKLTDDSSPLTSIDIPNEKEVPEKFDSEAIKSWQGSWKTIIDPAEIAQHVCQANAVQYHQAYGTPFCSEPLLSHFGHNTDKEGAQAII